MPHYTTKDVVLTVNQTPYGWVGSIPTWGTNLRKEKHMNLGHILGRKRNRLSRCGKRLASKDLTADQRNRITQRASELERELKLAKK